MRLQIHHDDEAGLEQAKGWLLDGFGRCLSDERQLDEGLVGIAASDAGIALTRRDCRPSASPEQRYSLPPILDVLAVWILGPAVRAELSLLCAAATRWSLWEIEQCPPGC